ncbi:MAG: hypothetical protein AB1529_02970 [Candidatus Micrarchaeota archaeon]
MKQFLMMMLVMALAVPLFATMSTEDATASKQLIDSNISCDKLSQEQLELIGEYFMEQMHPGQAHEAMDQMMGGEGSASLEQAHVQMALVLYCGQTNTSVTYGGMMGMMPMMGRFGGYGSGFGGGMMNYPYGGMMGYDMMGYGGWGWIVGLVFWVLVFVALILAIFWLYRSVTGTSRALTASEILKQRYARGEIAKKQYEEMKKDLE